jgi:hypothetical protein
VSHKLIFLPYVLGQTWPQAYDAATAAAARSSDWLTEARLEPWARLIPRAADVLGPIEDYRGSEYRELRHPFTGLRFTLFGGDGLLTLPYWYDAPVARKVCDLTYRLCRVIEDETGLAGFDRRVDRPVSMLTPEEFLQSYLDGRDEHLSLYGRPRHASDHG